MEIDFVLASPLHRRGKNTFFAKYYCRMDFFGITSSSQSKAFAKYSRQMDFFALFAKCFRHVDFFAKYFCRMDFLPFLQNIPVGWNFLKIARDFSSYFLQNLIQHSFIRIQKETFSM